MFQVLSEQGYGSAFWGDPIFDITVSIGEDIIDEFSVNDMFSVEDISAIAYDFYKGIYPGEAVRVEAV